MVCLFVCQQDYTKSTEAICSKPGGGMGHDPERKPLKFGADLVKGAVMTSKLFMLSDNVFFSCWTDT